MGKRERFNKKARQESLLDPSLQRKKNEELADMVNLGSSDLEYKLEHDTSNALVTQANTHKDARKKVFSKTKEAKVLTKKQKKKMECFLARKQKEKNRSKVLKSLSEHQVTPEELSHYKATTTIGQAIHGKRQVNENKNFDVSDITTQKSKANKKRKIKCNEMDIRSDGIPLPPIRHESDDEDDDDDDDSSDYDSQSKQQEQQCEENELGKEKMEKCVENISNRSIVNTNKLDSCDANEQIEEGKTFSSKTPVDESESVCLQIDLRNTNEISPKEESHNEPMAIAQTKSTVLLQTEHVRPIYVALNRNSEIQAARLLLPILPEEQVVMEKIQENNVVIICGSTGSGKTTQIPQFLFEAGYGTHSSRSGIIGVTEPRRVAAMSMSKRVAEEMNLGQGKVSYQIRFEGNTTDETKIKFMTDGVLLKEMETDFLLSKYSVIIIDEAHERSVYTDILIGMLTRVVPLRKKRGSVLKLIIMSATLRIEDFTENNLLFPKPPPVLKVDSRQYPVTIHFNRRTHDDYVTEAFRKVCKIHQSFKVDGGILVFLTGQREVLSLCNKLRKAFPKKQYTSILQSSKENQNVEDEIGILPKIDLDNYTLPNNNIEIEDDIEYYSSGDEECIMEAYVDETFPATSDYAPLHILPLYSLLPTKDQSKVFSEVPEGHRLCIISTNVAETSITIPGIKYIVDSGKVKSKFYDKVTGVSTFMITWISKASANQRAGRAGRVGPGHCYRLYSSAVFDNSFDEFAEPEIRRRPVEDLVLQMKNMCINKVINFPFPSPPEQTALKSSEELLLELGALRNTKTKQSTYLATITPLGKSLSKIPVSPRFAKMIYLASKKDCAQFIITIAAALAVKDIFTNDIDLSEISDIDEEDVKKKKLVITRARRKWAGDGPSSALGDLMVILRAVGACEYSNCSQKFCEDNGLRVKAMTEIRKLRFQLTKCLNNVIGHEDVWMDVKLNPPTNDEAVVIRQIILSCLADHVARKIPPEQAKSLKLKNAYQCCSLEDPVYIHPTSSLFTKLPEYVVFHEITETSKLYMKTLFTINEEWLPLHAPHKCNLGKPLDEPSPCYNQVKGQVQCYMTSTYGPHVWPLPPQCLPYPDCKEKYRWFAKLFLDGEICMQLKQFSASLVTPSSVMLKSWSHLQQKSEDILFCFMERGIDDKYKLLGEWGKEPRYILSHYLKWLPDSQHELVKYLWPPIQ